MTKLQKIVLAIFDVLVLAGFQLLLAWSIGVKNYCDLSSSTDCFALTSTALMILSAVFAAIYVFLCHKGFRFVLISKTVALLVCVAALKLSL